MFDIFPIRKFLQCVVVFTTILLVLKWATDACLPGFGHRHLFPKMFEAPTIVCEQMVAWEIWSLERESQARNLVNWYNSGPNALVTETGRARLIIFSDDLMKLPLLLKRVPGHSYPLLVLTVFVLLASIFFSILWHCVSHLVKVSDDLDPERYPYRRRRLTAATKVLEQPPLPMTHVRSVELGPLEQLQIEQIRKSR